MSMTATDWQEPGEVLAKNKVTSFSARESEDGTLEFSLNYREMLSLEEAAEFCRVKVPTIRQWVNKGLISVVRPGKVGRLLFEKTQLVADLSRLTIYANPDLVEVVR